MTNKNITENLDLKSVYDLIDIYNEESGKTTNPLYWSKKYKIPLNKSGLFNAKYKVKLDNLKTNLKKFINKYRAIHEEEDRLFNIQPQPEQPKPTHNYHGGMFNIQPQPEQPKPTHNYHGGIFDIQPQPEQQQKQKSHEERQIQYEEYKTFTEMKEHGNEIQKVLEEEIKAMKANPQKWILHLKNLDEKQRKTVFDVLLDFMQNELSKMYSAYSKFRVNYQVNGVWRSEPLTAEVYNKLISKFTEQSFVYDYTLSNTNYDIDRISNMIEEDIPCWNLFDAIGIDVVEKGNSRQFHDGSFFAFINHSEFNLTRYQIFDTLVDKDNKQRKELNDCCFVYALTQSEKFTDDELNKIRLRINNRSQHQKHLDKLCTEFRIHAKVHELNEEMVNKSRKSRTNGKKRYLGVTEDKAKYVLELNNYKNHYFLEEPTKISTSYFNRKYVQHIENINPSVYDKTWNTTKQIWFNDRRPNRFMRSGKLVMELMKLGYFTPITYDESSILKTIYYNHPLVDDISDLSYNPDECTRLIAPKDKKFEEQTGEIFYADFEADTTTEIHTPYMVCVASKSGSFRKTFTGSDCGKCLLDMLPDKSVVYFHNLAYDIRFLSKYGITKAINKGTKVMRANVKYNGKKLYFRDTLPMLSCKLSQMPKMFHLDNIKKELFPYNYYTINNLSTLNGRGIISDVGNDEKPIWTNEQREEFIANINSIPYCRLSENEFDMIKYSEFYCEQDVNVLRLSFNQFCESFKNEFGVNPFDYVSISSLANEVFKQRVYYPNGNLYEVGGIVRQFMSKAVQGGRCMCAYNKKWNVKGPISDYDAVSLYPSAMRRLWTVEGIPQVLTYKGNSLTNIPDELKQYSAYVIEIKITNVGKCYPFPLIVRREAPQDQRSVQHTPEGNLNKDTDISPENPVYMTVDNIALEDLVEFQKITYDIIKGYYWTGKRDYRIRHVIQEIFNKRVEYKNDKDANGNPNPLEQLYKLIMNSCYGKTIEKPVDKDVRYIADVVVNDKKGLPHNLYNEYYYRKYNYITEDIKLNDSNIHAIKTIKPIDDHFNFSLLGIQVLSMSKRIMNEVMCLAYDIGCHVYYQDTDSIHIMTDELPKLEEAFKQKYNRELKGTNLGQFHSDFPTINNHDEIPVSIHSIFLMKKMYVDVLTDSSNDIDYMFRGKGLTQTSIKQAAKRIGGIKELYEYLYQGKTVAFDLAENQASFKLNKNMTISTNEHFIRNVKTDYEEGKIKNYFS